MIALIARLKDEKGVPDLLAFLAEDKLYTRAFQALTAFDSPEVWKQTRAEIERLKHDGKIADGQHRQAAALLDRRIASPEEHFAAKAQAERHKELDAKRGALYATKNALPALKDSPEQYVAGYLAYLNSEERLAEEYADLPTVVGLRGDIGRDYFNLANLVRFRLKQPVKAIGLYGMAQKVGKPMALMAALAVADTYQFDVHDPAKALEVFRRLEADQRLDVSLGLLEPARSAATSWEGVYRHWLKNWLAHQVNYLKTGKPFGGTITEDDINGAALIIFLGGGMAMQDEGVASLYNSTAEALHAGAGTQIDRRAIGRTLDTLPPSSLKLQGTVMLLTLLPDVSAILRYLDKHDPAGYFGACLFAMVESIDRRAVTGREAMLLPGLALDPPGPANPLRAASARFLKERKVTLKIRPDPRGPTP